MSVINCHVMKCHQTHLPERHGSRQTRIKEFLLCSRLYPF